MRDPTTSESYIALRNALIAIQDDASAVHSVLSSRSDGGASFVAAAYYELRRSLMQGWLREAETLGRLIGTVLDVRDQGVVADRIENPSHRDAMRMLNDGIGAILGQDNDTGLRSLEALTEATYCNESLQWIAWLWTAKARADKGDLPRAGKAAEAALALAARLDGMAQGISLCRLAEIEFLSGAQDKALQHLSRASAVFDEVGDARGKATGSLTRARMLGRLDRDDEAVEAARQAQAADPDWEEPAIYLSEWLLGRELWEEARAVIQPFAAAEPVAPPVRRQLHLVELFSQGKIPGRVMRSYLDYKDRVPAEADLAVLKGLWEECPGFIDLRELLAWNLVKLEHDEQAQLHFEALAADEKDADVRASALLGLGCLASRRFGHRQSAARVRAAVSASQPSLPADAVPRTSAVQGESLGHAISKAAAEEEDAAAGFNREELTGPKRPPPKPTMPPPAPPWEGPTVPVKAVPAPQKRPIRPGKPATGPASAVAAPKAVFTGDLQLLAVPDLLEFLKSSRRTGTLVITSNIGIGAVHMRQGMLTGAASPNSKNMGQILQEAGKVTPEQLKEAADHQRADSPDRLIGSILVERGLVDRETLKDALVSQIKGAILEMIGWTAGRFAFEPDKRGQSDGSEVGVELDTQQVLLDVVRELDEANRDDEAEEAEEIAIDESNVDQI